jgi:hypothetical protein
MRWFQFAIIIVCLVCLTSCQKNNNYDLSEDNSETRYGEHILSDATNKPVTSPTEESTENTAFFSSNEEVLCDGTSSFDDINIINGLDGGAVDAGTGYIDSSTQSVRFEDFTFYREATGLSFDDKSYLDIKNTWQKLNVGDKFGTLTAVSAYSTYIPNGKQYENAEYLSELDANWCNRAVRFDGTVTLNGILTADLNDGAYWGNALFFQADPESLKEQEFPLLKSTVFCWTRDILPYGNSSNVEDTEVFYLGSVQQYTDIITLRDYADSDGFLKLHVTVELNDISLNYHIGTGSTPCGENTANLCSMLISELLS